MKRLCALRLYPGLYCSGVVATMDTVPALLTAQVMGAARADTTEVYRLVEESEWWMVVVPVSGLLR